MPSNQVIEASLSHFARKSGPRQVGLGRSQGPKHCFGCFLAYPSGRANRFSELRSINLARKTLIPKTIPKKRLQ